MTSSWKGDFREVDHNSQEYVIPGYVWEVIGREGVKSTKTIHSGFCRALPNIHTHQTLFTAAAYAFWFFHRQSTQRDPTKRTTDGHARVGKYMYVVFEMKGWNGMVKETWKFKRPSVLSRLLERV